MKLLQLVDQALLKPRGKLFSFCEQDVYGQKTKQFNLGTRMLNLYRNQDRVVL